MIAPARIVFLPTLRLAAAPLHDISSGAAAAEHAQVSQPRERQRGRDAPFLVERGEPVAIDGPDLVVMLPDLADAERGAARGERRASKRYG
jgi:hypothetical protein